MANRNRFLAASLLSLVSSFALGSCAKADDTDNTMLGATTGSTSAGTGSATTTVIPSGGATTGSMTGGPADGAGGNAPSMGGNPTGTIVVPTNTTTATTGTTTATMGTTTATMGTTTSTSSSSTAGGDGELGGGGPDGSSSGTTGSTGGTTGSTGGTTDTGGTNGGPGGGSNGGDFECVLPDLPDAGSLTDLGMKLPDPFTFYDGTPVTTKAQWDCRRKEILAMAAKYLYGPVPGDCDEVSGTVSGGSVSISCTVGGSTENFSATIGGSGSYIALDLSSGILPGGHKSLSFGNGFEGGIRSLYGLSELNPNIANGWMINRVMDVLELNPDSGHDPTKIAVSGCSGCGKGAFLAGVFSRVPMTVIVESGGGGGTSWRMTQYYRSGQGEYQCGDKPQGIDNLEDSGICGPWVTSAASSFRSNPESVNNMPFDQHMLLATIAPRYLVHFTNDHGPNSWCHLAGTSEALASWAAHSVFNALGVPERHSFEIYSGGHCGVGDTGIAAAMFDRAFNGNESADTGKVNIMDSRLQMPTGEWPEMWIDWNMETVLQ